MQALFGGCSILAVSQSIPLTAMQFARLYEMTLRDLRQNTPVHVGASAPSTTLHTRPACNHLVDDLVSDQPASARVLETVVGSENPALASPFPSNDTSPLIEAMRGSGKQRTAIAALAGRPVQYAVCSAVKWDNTRTIAPRHGTGENDGGPQLTYIAFLNSCSDYDARVKLDIVPAGASAAVQGMRSACASVVSA